MRTLPHTAFLILQMGLGTFVMGFSLLYWDLARGGAVVYFATGLAITLHTLYLDSKRSDKRIRTLEGKIANLENELVDLKNSLTASKEGN